MAKRRFDIKKYLTIGLAAIFLLILSSGPVSSESSEKIGYIDISRAFDEYQKTKDLDRELEKKGDAKQEERERIVKEIRKMREELELLNKPAQEKKEADIETKIKMLQEFDQEAKTDLVKERDNMVRDILKEMDDVIKEYGIKEGYSIILNSRVLLYGESNMDITNEIIKILNERYRK